MTDPAELIDAIDQLQRDCLALREQIRQHVALLHSQVAVWEPAPCPSNSM